MEAPPQQQTALYPGFEMTDSGLVRLHQYLGKLVHQTLEQEYRIEKLAADSLKGREMMAQMMAQQAAANAPKIETEDESGTEPIPTTQHQGVG